jgi:hypothetical protein
MKHLGKIPVRRIFPDHNIISFVIDQSKKNYLLLFINFHTWLLIEFHSYEALIRKVNRNLEANHLISFIKN